MPALPKPMCHIKRSRSMQIEVIDLKPGLAKIRLVGRLDTSGVNAIEARFSAAAVAQDADKIIDLSDVDFIASMGIRMLIATARAAHQKGIRIILYALQPAVLGVIENASLQQIISVADTEQQACATLG